MDLLINRRHNRQHQRSKKKVTPKILDLFGVALGCIGLSYDDFCKMDFDEFASVYAAYADQRDAAVKDEWSRMRLLATISIQPHLAKGKRVTPEKLLPFPWDRDHKPQNAHSKEELTLEQRRERAQKLIEKLGNTI